MQCNQLTRLIKGWFLHVKDETMAPARMMQFVDQHIKECEVCREDPDLHAVEARLGAAPVVEAEVETVAFELGARVDGAPELSGGVVGIAAAVEAHAPAPIAVEGRAGAHAGVSRSTPLPE